MGARPAPPPTRLSFEQERKLVDYADNRAAPGIGFGKRPFLQYARQFADKNGATFVKGEPSNNWWTGMKRRHPDLKI